MTYPLDTLGPTIDETGISVPSFFDVHQSLIATFKAIYGSDIYISEDSQDGQLIGILAKAIDDCNQAAVAVFQAFSPDFAQGTNLSTLVKINGLARQAASYSTAVGDVVGQVGSVITNGVVEDVSGNLWNLPETVVIPQSGTISVTVVAQELGDIQADVGSINEIYTPQLGWQSFTNTSAAAVGAAVETDLALRSRQTVSTALPALTIKEAILGAVANVEGVSRYAVHENDTSVTDADGVPAHSISVVVLGGDSQDIAEAIASRKAPGIQTYGDISVSVFDQYGLETIINYFELTLVPIYYAIEITALSGYISTTGQTLKQALVDFVNALSIEEDVYVSQSQAAASLISLGLGHTFYISSFALGFSASPVGTSNLTIAFNEAASCALENIELTVI